MFEAANVLRRWMTSGRLPQEIVALAHDDLLALPLELWPYALLAEQVQRLAGAELLDLPLVTLDRRLAHGPRDSLLRVDPTLTSRTGVNHSR